MASPSINLTDEQIALLLEQATAPTPTEGGDAPPPLKYRIGNQTFEAKTPDELQQQIDAAMTTINATVQQLQAKQQPAPQATPAAPAFDKETYAKLFLEDPLAAHEYVDSIRFGVQKPAQVLQTVIRDVGAMEQAMAVQQFLGNTEGEYLPTPENFATLSSYMGQYQLPWTANGLKLAFSQARQDGKIRIDDADGPASGGGFNMPTRRGVPIVPRGMQSSSANIDQDLLQRFEDLPPEKMKAFLENMR